MPNENDLKTIRVEVDPVILERVDLENRPHVRIVEGNKVEVEFELHDMIYSIGAVQSPRFNPTEREKYSDYEQLLEKIADRSEFSVKIGEIRNRLGGEKLGKFSENFGVGIAAIVIDKIIDIDRTTICRISESGKRPDFQCETTTGEVVIVESKGSIDKYYLRDQRENAIIQKNQRSGAYKISAFTHIQEDQGSTVELVDPPVVIPDLPAELRHNVMKCIHYSSVFSLIGERRLSLYFSQMKNRLLGWISSEQLDQKDALFIKIKDTYRSFSFENILYYGSTWRISPDLYEFWGVPSDLLSFPSFFSFTDQRETQKITLQENEFSRFRDGLLRVLIRNPSALPEGLLSGEIFDRQRFITISDADHMSPIVFESQVAFLIKWLGYTVTNATSYDLGWDFLGLNSEGYTAFIVKMFSKEGRKPPSITYHALTSKASSAIPYPICFITNATVTSFPETGPHFRIIDRDKLISYFEKLKPTKAT